MKKYIAIIIAVLAFVSCNEWLDGTENNTYLTDELVWKDEASAQLYVNGFYTYISKYGQFGTYQFGGSMTESLTDTFKYGSLSLGHKAGHPNNYVVNPEAITTAGCLWGIWGTAYENIRRVNGFLDSMHKFSKLAPEKNTLLEAQARFFRAFIYFQLAKRHPKGVILYDTLPVGNDKALSSADETWQFIYDDLKFAAENLPAEWKSADNGRVTKYAAYAFMSRAMLYAERWDDVIEAADSVISCGKYGLVDKYQDSWKGGNKESILEFKYTVSGPNHTFDQDYVPLCDGYDYGALGTPTQEMVETYERYDGTDFDWSAWHNGTATNRPNYESLEPRFAATVIYPGCEWKGKTMNCSVHGENGEFVEYGTVPYSYGKTTTGYFLRKLVDESHTDLRGVQSTQTWVEIRYAEVLLNKAEAMYRSGAPAIKYQNPVDQVRARVGLYGKNLTGDDWWKAYRRERKVELAYEGHYFWDLRRWKVAHTELTGYRVHGFMITGTTYEYVSCDLEDRRFFSKLYCLPVPDDELKDNKLAVQYDEWK